MKPTTLAAVVAVALLLGGVVAFGLAGGSGGGAPLAATWTSDTGTGIAANHHAVAVAGGRVYAPISGTGGTGECALVALDAGNGTPIWDYEIPAANCTIHSVADPTVSDVDGDGAAEVLAATTEREVTTFDAGSGAVTSRYRLSDYGYTKPVVADLSAAPGSETVAVDVTGTVFVFGADGTVLWRAALDEYVWAQPVVDDFDADGDPELLVAGREGDATLFAGDGSVEWNRTVAAGDSITWGTHGQADGDGPLEAVLATVDGDVVAVNGASGRVEWRRNIGAFGAVHAFDDGDDDGDPEVYATSRDGTLRALDAASGDTEWETEIVTERVQMMPPPNLGDLDGDGDPELLAAGNDGSVTLVDPSNGAVLSTDGRDVPIFTHATLADVDGDGAHEALVMYADGRVVRLDAPLSDGATGG
ncbi:outer membrane protein assembly factor BamB family protein [Halobellus ruber]|uniref:PQQ-binding-like beta-propeller repeat protein n=1 Tax=Halobellus ruber TaxID=2761102 RepID=A0A7J9SHC7_9EURY|nr:PQQ-binding-like beta-propeller repeat protein [Halobellus ruber]